MIFNEDKLERKPYADILTQIIDNPQTYKRNSDSDSFTMAIDSSWGTGKTEFLKMWKEQLEEEKKGGGKSKYIVIYYNSWANDFASDPLQSIIYTILTHEAFEIDKKEKVSTAIKQVVSTDIKEGLKKAFETVVQTAKSIPIPVVQVAAELLDKGTQVTKQVADTMNKETFIESRIKEFKDYKKGLTEIKDMLEKVTYNTKIIMLIDELDRCKPLFAIKLLETIKHIFNVRNMSFVFALDMSQLSYSVEKVYGSRIDAPGYLCRFFDYVTKMPQPNTRKYLEYLMEKKPLIRKELHFKETSLVTASTHSTGKRNILEVLEYYAQVYNLSLRDINTIYCNFAILEERELKDVNSQTAYALYLFFLILKYKRIGIFNKLFITHTASQDEEEFKIIYNNKYITKDNMRRIIENKPIEKIDFDINPHGFGNVISEVDLKSKTIYYMNRSVRTGIEYNNNTELSQCLFYSDIENYNTIKEIRIADYIHQKLELYNFELNT